MAVRYTSAHMCSVRRLPIGLSLLALVLTADRAATAQQITAAGQPAQLDIRAAGDASIRVTLKPLSFKNDFPEHPAVVDAHVSGAGAERA